MDAIYLLIPIALILVIVGLGVFFWAVKSDQFEDLEGPAHTILFDDDQPSTNSKTSSQDNDAGQPRTDNQDD